MRDCCQESVFVLVQLLQVLNPQCSICRVVQYQHNAIPSLPDAAHYFHVVVVLLAGGELGSQTAYSSTIHCFAAGVDDLVVRIAPHGELLLGNRSVLMLLNCVEEALLLVRFVQGHSRSDDFNFVQLIYNLVLLESLKVKGRALIVVHKVDLVEVQRKLLLLALGVDGVQDLGV